MKKFLTLILTLLLVATYTLAQSGRSDNDGLADPKLAKMTASQLFTEASVYVSKKVDELIAKKARYTRTIHQNLFKEREKLAAKYAAHLSSRDDLKGDDFYYLGRLEWLAKNKSKAGKAFTTFLGFTSADKKKQQAARSVIVAVESENGNMAAAEKMLASYFDSEPVSDREVLMMRKQLSADYRKSGNMEKAAVHGDEAFEKAKLSLFSVSRNSGLGQLQDSGVNAFEINRELGRKEKAAEQLVALRKYAAAMNSHAVYIRAIDEHIRFLIDSKQREAGYALYENSFKLVEREITIKSVRQTISNKLISRKHHYTMLGLPAPEITDLNTVFPKTNTNLKELKGKVVLLDFWATWCGPCFDAFPSLTDWHNRFSDKGLVVLGMTRLYGTYDDNPTLAGELKYLRDFREEYKLPYPFVVASNQKTQIKYGAQSLPTAVLIDKEGIVRYVSTGINKNKKQEIEELIIRLLKE